LSQQRSPVAAMRHKGFKRPYNVFINVCDLCGFVHIEGSADDMIQYIGFNLNKRPGPLCIRKYRLLRKACILQCIRYGYQCLWAAVGRFR